MVIVSNIGNKLMRSQRYVVLMILAVFIVLMVITAAAGRGYVDKEIMKSSLANTYNNLWGDVENPGTSPIEVPDNNGDESKEQRATEKNPEPDSVPRESADEESRVKGLI